MQPYTRMSKAQLATFAAGMIGVGTLASIGMTALAQQTAPSSSTPVASETRDMRDNDNDANVVLPGGGITEEAARAVITAQYPGVIIESIELEDENGTVLYGAELSNGTEVTVNATTGAVTQDVADQEDGEHHDKGGHTGKNSVKEEALTGDTATKVTAAVQATLPGATIDRMETDAEGATYEAHVTKSDGSHVTLKFDTNFNITATEDGGIRDWFNR